MKKNAILGVFASLSLFAFASCSYSGQATINVNGYLLTTPSQEFFIPSHEQVPPVSSGMDGVDMAVEKMYFSKSNKSAVLISSVLVNVGQEGEDFAGSYMEALKKQLEASGDVQFNPRDGNDGLKISSLVFSAGDILTDKVMIYALDKPNALMIDFVFDKSEFESLQSTVTDLLDSISFAE
ncbi:MAG: hypothetical protein K6A42_07155 [Treponema sp.]|nr:hypothetical protein [Treponema sp.]